MVHWLIFKIKSLLRTVNSVISYCAISFVSTFACNQGCCLLSVDFDVQVLLSQKLLFVLRLL